MVAGILDLLLSTGWLGPCSAGPAWHRRAPSSRSAVTL